MLDITNREPKDSLFKYAVEASPTGMLLVDAEGIILMCNSSAVSMFGYSREELVGKTVGLLIAVQEQHRHESHLQKYFSAPKTRKMGEAGSHQYALHKNRTEFPVEIALNPIETEDGVCVLASINDLSAIIEKDKQLNSLAELNRITLDAAPIGIALSDEHGNWLRVNRAFCDMLGYSEAELLAGSYEDIAHPEHLESDNKIILQLLTKKSQVVVLETRFKHKDGFDIWASLHCAASFDDDGEPDYIIGQVQDISEQVRLRESQKETEAILNTFFETIPAVISIKDREHRYTRLNSHATKIFARDKSEIIGNTYEEIFAEEPDKSVKEVDERVLCTGESTQHELHHVVDNEERTFLSNVFAIRDKDNNVSSVARLSFDITDRKKEELRLFEAEKLNNATIDKAPIGIALSDLDGNWIKLNHTFCDMVGYEPEELENTSFAMITHADDIEYDIKHISAMLNGEINLFREEKRYIHKDGHEVWVMLHVSRIDDKQGTPQYFACQIQDLSDQKATEKSLKTLESQLSSFVDNSPTYITLKDTEHRYILANDAVADYLQSDKDELIGKTCWDFFPEDVAKNIQADEEEVLTTGIAHNSERVQQDGETYIYSNIFPIFNEDNEIASIATISIDISDRKRFEKQIKLQAKKLTLLQQIAVYANESEDVKQVMQSCLQEVCLYMGWKFGHVYHMEADDQSVLESKAIFHTDKLDEHIAAIVGGKCPKSSLISKVCNTNAPAWLLDISQEAVYVQSELFRHFKAAIAFPVIVDKEVVAVFEFLNDEVETPDEELLELFKYISQQVGYIINRDNDRKSITEALQRIKHYASNSPLATLELDQDMQLIQWSEQAERLFGWTKQDALGKTPFELGMIYPEDLKTVRNEIMSPMINGEIEQKSVHNRNWTKDGEIRQVEWFNSALTDDSGAVTSMISFGLDRTEQLDTQLELAESQKRFELAVSATNEGIYDWQLNKRQVWLSDHLLQMLGLDSGHPNLVSDDILQKLIHPDDTAAVQEMKNQLRYRAVELKKEYRIKRQNSGYIWVQENAISVVSKYGEVNRVVGTFADISERKHAEKILQKYTDDLKRSNSELEQFAFVASHDMQEPLRMVAGFTELLADQYRDKLDANGKEYIGFARDGAIRMQQLINDLLEYYRLGAESKPFESIDLQEELATVLDDYRFIIEDKKAEINYTELPKIMGDRQQILQLLRNLIGNSLKYTSNDEIPYININCKLVEQNWQISVTDNGIGIDPKFFDNIFNVFKRLHGKSEYSGTGIGLAMCKKIVQRHGGRIWVESVLGKGATFTFTMPGEHN